MRRSVSICGAASIYLSVATVGGVAAKPNAVPQTSALEIRVVFDNTSARPDLRRSWGFSAVVDLSGRRILCDAGSDPVLLLEHLDLIQIDPKSIEHAVISHQHGDHLRGVYWVFEKNPNMSVHFLDCFPEEPFRRAAAVNMKPHRVTGPFEVVPGIYSTSIIDGCPPVRRELKDVELFLSSAARDHRFGVRGIEGSDVRWRGRSGRELLRRQA